MDFDLVASIAASPIATVVTDPRREDNPIVAINAAFEQLTGYAAAEVVGCNCRFLARGTTHSAKLRDAVAGRRAAFDTIINYRKDGSEFLNALMIAPQFDASGALEYFVGSQMDVSASGAADSRRAFARAALGRLTARQRQVLDLMAKGLRNKQIAGRLSIDERTVKMHRAALISRLGAVTSTDAVRIAVEAGG